MLGNKVLSKEFGKKAAVGGLMASTAVGLAALGVGQASASPTAPLSPHAGDAAILNALDAFAHQFAKAQYSDDTSRIRMSEAPDLSPDGSGTAAYLNPLNKAERFAIYCSASGSCSGLWKSPK